MCLCKIEELRSFRDDSKSVNAFCLRVLDCTVDEHMYRDIGIPLQKLMPNVFLSLGESGQIPCRPNEMNSMLCIVD